MAEFIELAAEKQSKEAGKDKSPDEKLYEGVQMEIYRKMLEKLKLVEANPFENKLPHLELAKIVRDPGDRGPVGPVGRIEDLLT